MEAVGWVGFVPMDDDTMALVTVVGVVDVKEVVLVAEMDAEALPPTDCEMGSRNAETMTEFKSAVKARASCRYLTILFIVFVADVGRRVRTEGRRAQSMELLVKER